MVKHTQTIRRQFADELFVFECVFDPFVGLALKGIISFRFGISENKKISIIQVTHESDHISLLRDSTMSGTQNVLFYYFFL